MSMSMFGLGSVPELMELRYDEFFYLAQRLTKLVEEKEREASASRGKGIFSSRFPI